MHIDFRVSEDLYDSLYSAMYEDYFIFMSEVVDFLGDPLCNLEHIENYLIEMSILAIKKVKEDIKLERDLKKELEND